MRLHRRTAVTLIAAIGLITALGLAIPILVDQAVAHGWTCSGRQLHTRLHALPVATLSAPGGHLAGHEDCRLSPLGPFGEGADNDVRPIYRTSTSPQQVSAFYAAQLWKDGWQIMPAYTARDGSGGSF
jgi:hypothetical protein